MFRVGNPVTGKEFFDRTDMKNELKVLLKNQHNFMIKAPRRYGKTSLIKQVMKEEKLDYLYLDIRKTPRLSLLTEQIMNYTYKQAGVKGFMRGVTNNAITLMKNAKHSLKIDYSILEYSVEFFIEEQEPFELFREALSTIDKVAIALNKPIYVVFDEFQDIQRLNYDDIDMLEVIRGEIQHHKNTVYSFLGSVEHLMTKIFETKLSPFFNFCTKFRLKSFDVDELVHELEASFKKKGILIENPELLKKILLKLNGHPANTMLTMQKLHLEAQLKNKVLLKELDIEEAYWVAYTESEDLINQYIIELHKRKHYHDVLYRLANNEKQELTAQALNQVYKGLRELGYIVSEERGKYVIIDGFLEEFLKN